jgi:hypothetical protein
VYDLTGSPLASATDQVRLTLPFARTVVVAAEAILSGVVAALIILTEEYAP